MFEPLVGHLPESARKAVGEALESATWIRVRRALTAFDQCPPEARGPEATIQILSTYSAEAIEPALRLGLCCLPCRPRLEFAPLDTIDQQLFDRSSSVYKKGNLATVVLWRVEELLPELLFPFSNGGFKEMTRRSLELQKRIRKLAQAYLETATTPLFLSTLPLPAMFGSSVLDAQLGSGLAGTIAQVNAKIFELGLQDSRIRILDVNGWSAREGLAGHDAQMDYLGRQPFTVRAALSLGVFLARNLRPLIVPRRKVLALDLDNTLWGGILGEDGAAQLKLGRDFPGNVFLRIQREILELKHQGVLLLLASKNEPADVRQSIERMPDMLLKWEDFVCHKINFNPKYLNLREAATELGLGLNSFAFLDDSDFEREQMKTFNPEVLIVNDRPDALHMLTSLLHSDAFDTLQVSEEDQHRHQDYTLRAARSAPQDGNVEDFLKSLQLKARLEPVNNHNIDRVVQLLGKTNQFNLTTRRHRLEDLRNMLSSPGFVSLTLRLEDKFGDQGIVGVLLAKAADHETKTLDVDSFLISCRALGRGVEEVLWAALVNRALRAGRQKVVGEYLPTAKNGIVASLYDCLGLRRVAESATRTEYLFEVNSPIPFPEWMTVLENDL
jgi:FkbH-like protein